MAAMLFLIKLGTKLSIQMETLAKFHDKPATSQVIGR
jgi:hypothetical protein